MNLDETGRVGIFVIPVNSQWGFFRKLEELGKRELTMAATYDTASALVLGEGGLMKNVPEVPIPTGALMATLSSVAVFLAGRVFDVSEFLAPVGGLLLLVAFGSFTRWLQSVDRRGRTLLSWLEWVRRAVAYDPILQKPAR